MGKSRARRLRPELSPQHHFGAEVRLAREAAGMTLADLAQRVPCSVTGLARTEAGDSPPTQGMVHACDRAFPNREGWFTRFFTDQAGWDIGSRRWMTWREVVPVATTLRWWEPLIIPGPLQTEGYAKTLIMSWLPDGEVPAAEDLAERMEARDSLLGDSPTGMLALIDLSVLYRDVGGPEVMADQVGYLIKMSQLPHVTIQVVPGTGLAGYSGAFAIATRATTDVAAYLDASVQPTAENDPALVMRAVRLFDHLRSFAHPAGVSAQLMMEAQESWSQRQ